MHWSPVDITSNLHQLLKQNKYGGLHRARGQVFPLMQPWNWNISVYRINLEEFPPDSWFSSLILKVTSEHGTSMDFFTVSVMGARSCFVNESFVFAFQIGMNKPGIFASIVFLRQSDWIHTGKNTSVNYEPAKMRAVDFAMRCISYRCEQHNQKRGNLHQDLRLWDMICR